MFSAIAKVRAIACCCDTREVLRPGRWAPGTTLRLRVQTSGPGPACPGTGPGPDTRNSRSAAPDCRRDGGESEACGLRWLPGPGARPSCRNSPRTAAASAAPALVNDLPAAVAEYERARPGGEQVRWVWADTVRDLPVPAAGPGSGWTAATTPRLTEALLRARDGAGLAGTAGPPRPAARAVQPGRPARAQAGRGGPAGGPVRPGRAGSRRGSARPSGPLVGGVRRPTAPRRRTWTTRTWHAGCCARPSRPEALAAVEMMSQGRSAVERGGPRRTAGLTAGTAPGRRCAIRPDSSAALAARFQEAVGGRPVNPDSPAQVLAAFARVGVPLSSTRSHVLREVDHPAAALLQRYKELSRIHSAHGWAWREQWVRGGRFRPEYVVGGVGSGRWASRGGGALQIPGCCGRPWWRTPVTGSWWRTPGSWSPGCSPRCRATARWYGRRAAATCTPGWPGPRSTATGPGGVALLAAMYGQTSGEAGQLLAILRRRFPEAMDLVESAARTGEAGGVVRSRLGRTSPRPSSTGQDEGADGLPDTMDGADSADGGDYGSSPPRGRPASGRFTRNFVIQASAADWALAMLAALRRRLRPRVRRARHGAAPGVLPARRGDRAHPAGVSPLRRRRHHGVGGGGQPTGLRPDRGALPARHPGRRVLRRREVSGPGHRPGRVSRTVSRGLLGAAVLALARRPAGRSLDRQAGQVLTGAGSPNTT